MSWKTSFLQATAVRSVRRYGGLLVVSALLSLNACAMAEAPETPADANVPVPEAAIQVGPELYMIPMGTDERGCPVFQPWSPTLMVVQALHWRAADGSFTLDRDAADCPPLEDSPQNGNR